MRGTTPEKIVCVRSYSFQVGGPATDQEADAFVRAKASEGSAYHIEALAYVAFTEPTEPRFISVKDNGELQWLNISDTKFPIIQTS